MVKHGPMIQCDVSISDDRWHWTIPMLAHGRLVAVLRGVHSYRTKASATKAATRAWDKLRLYSGNEMP